MTVPFHLTDEALQRLEENALRVMRRQHPERTFRLERKQTDPPVDRSAPTLNHDRAHDAA